MTKITTFFFQITIISFPEGFEVFNVADDLQKLMNDNCLTYITEFADNLGMKHSL